MSGTRPGLTPRRAVALALLFLVGAVGVLALASEAAVSVDASATLPDDAASTRVVELRSQFPEAEDSVAVVLYTADQGELGRATVTELEGSFAAATRSPAPLEVSQDGSAAIGVVPVQAQGSSAVSAAVEDLRTSVGADLPDGVGVQVTGPAAIEADLSAVFDGADTRLLLVTASVVAVLLILTYRSPLLWLVPLTIVGLADRMAAVLATRGLDALGVPFDESTVGILSVLVFGAGTDYALLLISRYRDELKSHEDRYVAMWQAWRRTTEAVLASAATVVVAVLVLLLSSFPTTRGLGLASAIGIAVAAVSVLVALPATLVLCGRWVFWPLVPRMGQPPLVEAGSVWGRIGRVVARAPGLLIAACVLVLGGLALGLAQVQTGLSTSEQFLAEPEAITAAERLASSFPAGAADPTLIVTRGAPAEVRAAVDAVPGADAAAITEGEDGWRRVQVVLDAAPGSVEAESSVRALRDAVRPLGSTYVGGAEAEAIDADEAAARDRLLIVPLVLGLVLLVLVGLLRSLVAPVVLVATVVATYLSALGVSWLIFTGLLGFEAIDVGMPLLAFLFLVALGVDYNIFLVTRAAEESAGRDPRTGMLRALAATGGVITSAGILLAAVFAVLGVLPLVVLAQLGIVIGVGVLLDTLLVRTLLVPAIAVVMGEAFWWPRRVGRPARVDQAETEPGRVLAS